MAAKPRVVVVGSGFAGLETAFLLRFRMPEEIDLFVVSDGDCFLFKPNTIYIPFGADPEAFHVSLAEPLRRKNIGFFQAPARDVDPERRRVLLEDGTALRYDFLVLATGAAMRPQEVPGLEEHACSIWTPREMLELRGRLEILRDEAEGGAQREVLFLVPPNNRCSGPLYELAFMLETWLRRIGIRDRVHIVFSTFEKRFIQSFGPRLDEVVSREFAERSTEGRTGEQVERVTAHEVLYRGGSRRGFDLLITFPPHVAAVSYPALAADERGFLLTELGTRQVLDQPGVYAPGDGGDFPVKQAFLAFLQADAVADHVTYQVSGRPFRSPFDPVSLCVMEMFDKAAFAQVPLRLTGDPEQPVAVRPDADGEYRLGVSPLWRLGKKLLGVYLPMRFRAGEPFHAGMAWRMMDVGLKGMSGILAD